MVFGLINMNGRMYDPMTGQMLAPDNYVPMAWSPGGYNRYNYANSNPLKFIDPDGEFWHLVIGAVIGGAVNLISNAIQGKVKTFGDGVKYFGIGALAGALGAGIGAGVSTAIAGGSFGAGFMGTTTVASTGFFAGAASGAAGGGSSGFVLGMGNSLIQGNNFGTALKQGFSYGTIGAIGGGILGGITGGISALHKKVDFWNGKANGIDLSKGFGAEGNIDLTQKIKIKYVGRWQNTNIYETSNFSQGQGITLPGFGITVGKGVYSQALDMGLMQHEYGHILQALDIGIPKFYHYVAPASGASASAHGIGGHLHNHFWTETWANYLSQKHFGSQYMMNLIRFPIKDLNSIFYFWLKYIAVL